MADEKTAYRYLKESGLEPIEHKAIIVKYAPESDDLSFDYNTILVFRHCHYSDKDLDQSNS